MNRSSVLSSNEVSAPRREYGLTRGRKIEQSVLGVAFLVGAGFCLGEALDPRIRELAYVAMILLVPGVWILLKAWRGRLILDGDVMEVRYAFRIERARREEIQGLRTMQNRYGRWTRVYLGNGRDAFNVSDFFTGNADLKEWFKGVPDLDQRDADAIEMALGREESNRLGMAKRWAIGLSILAGLLSIPVMFVSYQPAYQTALALLLVCTPIGIALLRGLPLLFTAFRRKPDPRAELSFLVLWPALGVLWSYQRANDPFYLVQWLQLWPWALAVLAGFVIALFPIAWKTPSRGASLAAVVFIGAIYGVGVVNAVNTLPDLSEARVYRTSIVEMHTSRNSKGTRYYLRVAPWGPIAYWNDLSVPRQTYVASRVGDAVCFGLHAGVLGAAWYTSVPCGARGVPALP